MKLIIKEYLASLKERDELDVILPDLLSEMGLTVFSRPGRGTRQNGVDVAAVGCLTGDTEKVYLISIKSGDLTRSTWDSDSLQSLRPSLNEIIDSYIPNRLPIEHKDKPIVICLCFGGDIQEQVRLSVKGYIKQNSKNGLEFVEWNGDKLAELILSSFLKEDLLPKCFRSLLRKSLALLDEPEVSFEYFKKLVNELINFQSSKDTEKLTAIRQINICLWILFAWCREANNLESAYLSGEYTLLHSWEIFKHFIDSDNKLSKAIHNTFGSIHYTYNLISRCFLKDKILPFTDKLHALSRAVKPTNKIDVNLKLFDILGRIAMAGIWIHWQLKFVEEEKTHIFKKDINMFSIAIKQIITNNPILFSPYKDEQAIDIAMAAWFLALDSNNKKDIYNWLLELTERIIFNFKKHKNYPSNINVYSELVEHPLEKSDAYRKEITEGSILYPTLAVFSALLGFDDIYTQIKNFKNECLNHCNFQFLYPDETSENNFYSNSSIHGATLSHICVEKSKEEFIGQIFKECDETNHFKEMSAVKFGLWPLIFLGCRHYRLPIPIHFFKELVSNT